MQTTIFTWGYYGWGNHTPQLVECVDAVETSRGFAPPLFVDIGIRRSVRAAGFNGSAFEKRLGQDRHRWMKSLGNTFIETRTGPHIQIAQPAAADELLDRAIESARWSSPNRRSVRNKEPHDVNLFSAHEGGRGWPDDHTTPIVSGPRTDEPVANAVNAGG
jgi:hypothetical protein